MKADVRDFIWLFKDAFDKKHGPFDSVMMDSLKN